MIAIIDILPLGGTKKEQIINDLCWYDVSDKTMYSFKGTYLAFNYDSEKRKMIVSAVIQERKIPNKENNLNDIMSWINEIDSDIEIISEDSREIIISFSEKDRTVIEASMYQKRFRYEIKNVKS